VVGAPIGVYSLWMLITRRWEVADLWRLRVPEGVVIVLLICAPWPLAVLQRVPDAMQQWDSEYLERYSGELRDVDRGEWWEVFYYLPMLALFVLPWCLSVPEAVAAPFMARYRKHREGLPLLWCWLTVSTLIIGLAAFKRAHYALPSVPALILLLGVVVDDFFFGTRVFRPRRVIGFTAAVAAVLASLGLATMHELREQAPDATVVVLVCGVLALLMVSLAGGCFALRRRLLSFIFVGLVSPAVLIAGWSVFKAMPDDRDAWRRFASAVDEIVPPDEPLRWVGRPSAPAVFYGGGRLVAPRIDDPVHLLKATGGDFPSRVEWMLLSADRIAERLRDPEPIWLVIEAEEFADLRSVMDFPARVAAESHATGDERLLLVTNVFPVPASEPQG
jgi:4-amino-4-deoxy-L-arabinose transferase-like glycosyltransferase